MSDEPVFAADPYAPPSAEAFLHRRSSPVLRVPPPPKTGWARWRVPVLLYLLTFLSTILFVGPVYSLAIMVILTAHELGHFFQARRYHVPASPPYFIPFPSLLGTMGAVIAMRSRVADRKALFDIAVTGPLAGLVPTLVCCLVGIPLSTVATVDSTRNMIELGEPLIFTWLTNLLVGPVPDGQTLILHDLAYAGWAGLLVTGLNLIPIGQLDGGHLLYALLRRRSHPIALGLVGVAVTAIVMNWIYRWWAVMLVLLLVMGPLHPPTADDEVPLGWGRVVIGWLALAFVVIGFMPRPIIRLPF